MTKSITTFDVVLVPFPFSDLQRIKRRPCLVLSCIKPPRYPEHFIIAMMTSHLERHFPHDIVLDDSEEAGLPKSTLVRLAKLVTVDGSVLIKKLGTLSSQDKKRVVKEWKALFQEF